MTKPESILLDKAATSRCERLLKCWRTADMIIRDGAFLLLLIQSTLDLLSTST